MEINGTSDPARLPVGPRPARGRGTARSAMSAQRTAILDRLTDQPEPLSVAALVAATGLHENTVREHLDALIEAGYAERTRAEPSGRGRPAWLYASTGRVDPTVGEYAGLAAALAAHIERTSAEPRRDALDAGRSWGRELARQDLEWQSPGATTEPSGRVPSAAAARRRVVALLDELGFAPEPDARGTRARLTRCPLLEAAHQHPQVVCGVHLGIVQGALEEYGVPEDQTARTDLIPFAEPGACRLHLLTRSR